jgi:hypothetical protein
MDHAELRRRRRILLVMLTALSWKYPPAAEPELVRLLQGWLSGWPGSGRIVLGMIRQGYDLQLTRYGEEGWRANFYPAGREHSMTSAVGSAWQSTPWRAVQQAAWDALVKAERAV